MTASGRSSTKAATPAADCSASAISNPGSGLDELRHPVSTRGNAAKVALRTTACDECRSLLGLHWRIEHFFVALIQFPDRAASALAVATLFTAAGILILGSGVLVRKR